VALPSIDKHRRRTPMRAQCLRAYVGRVTIRGFSTRNRRPLHIACSVEARAAAPDPDPAVVLIEHAWPRTTAFTRVSVSTNEQRRTDGQ